MARNSKHTKNFSIDPEKHGKVLDIFDQWDKQGLNQSNEMCKAVKFYQTDKDRGTKIEQYIDPEQQLQLMKMPHINQELKDEDIELLSDSMTYTEFYQLCMLMEINLNRMLHARRSPATTYKRPLSMR